MTIAQPGKYGTQPIKHLMQEERVTQANAAWRAGVTTQTITMVLNGHARPSLPVAYALMRLFPHVKIDQLFTKEMLTS